MATPTNRNVNIYINQASAESSLKNLQVQADKMTTAIKKGEAAGKDMTAEIEKLAKTDAKISQLGDVISGKLQAPFKLVRARVAELRRELEGMSTDAPGYAAKFAEFQKVTARFNEMRDAVRGVTSVLDTAQASSQSFLSKLKDGITQGLGIGGVLGIVSIISNIKNKLVDFAKESFDAAAGFEQIQVAYSTLLGSKEKANQLLRDLQKFAQETPFELSQLNALTKQLLAYGFAQDEIIPSLSRLGDVAAGVGSDKLPQLVLAFGQIRANGKLMGQDLNQLVQTGFNPLQIISDKTGKSIGELRKDMEAGKITFKDVEGAFKTATSEGGEFFNLMQNQSKTTSGVISNLQDAFGQLQIAIGNRFTSAIKTFALVLTNLVTGFGDLIGAVDHTNDAFNALQYQNEKLRELEKSVTPLIDSYERLGTKMVQVGGFTKLNTDEQKQLKEAVQGIATAIPGAITQFDQYGKGLNISADAAREFIELQRNIQKELNRDAIASSKKTISSIEKQIQATETALETARTKRNNVNSPSAKVKNLLNGGPVGGTGGSQFAQAFALYKLAKETEVLDDVIVKTQTHLAELQGRLSGQKGILSGLSGDPVKPKVSTNAAEKEIETLAKLRESLKQLKDAREQLAITDTKGLSANLAQQKVLQTQIDALDGAKAQKAEKAEKAEKSAAKKAQALAESAEKEMLAFQQKIQQIQDEINAKAVSSDEEELQRIREKYDKLAREDEAYFAKYKQRLISAGHLNELESQELNAKLDQQMAKHQAEVKKVQEAETKEVQKGIQDRIAIARSLVSENAKDLKATIKAQKEHEKEIKQIAIATANALTDIAGSFFSYLNAKDQNRLDSDRHVNDQKKQNLQKALDANRISQSSYNRQVSALDKELDQKDKELKIKQFNRNKAFSLVQAGIKVAEAITVALTAGPFIAQALAIVTAAAGAVQIGFIAASKPPQYEKGGIANGASHAEGGISMIDSGTGQKVGEMEGGEPYMILSKETMKNNGRIINALLDASMNGRGRPIQPKYITQAPARLNYAQGQSDLQYLRTYASGGVVRGGSNAAIPDDVLNVLKSLNQQLSQGIRADVSWNDIDRKNKINASLRKAGSYGAVG